MRNASYTGAWAVDIEADGDLDIVLGTKTGEPTVLRNNGDDTFTAFTWERTDRAEALRAAAGL